MWGRTKDMVALIDLKEDFVFLCIGNLLLSDIQKKCFRREWLKIGRPESGTLSRIEEFHQNVREGGEKR